MERSRELRAHESHYLYGQPLVLVVVGFSSTNERVISVFTETDRLCMLSIHFAHLVSHDGSDVCLTTSFLDRPRGMGGVAGSLQKPVPRTPSILPISIILLRFPAMLRRAVFLVVTLSLVDAKQIRIQIRENVTHSCPNGSFAIA